MTATPEKWEQSRAQKNPRFKRPNIPIVAENLVAVFDKMGRLHNNGMMLMPLPYAEIVACARWASEQEVDLIRMMSREYLEGYHIGKDPFGIPPWSPDDD